MIAKAFELKTMKVSRLTARMAGDRVDGEDHVAGLDDDEHREQRRGEALPAPAG
jgi:hypothetical protein